MTKNVSTENCMRRDTVNIAKHYQSAAGIDERIKFTVLMICVQRHLSCGRCNARSLVWHTRI